VFVMPCPGAAEQSRQPRIGDLMEHPDDLRIAEGFSTFHGQAMVSVSQHQLFKRTLMA